jgi:hypothetical protein
VAAFLPAMQHQITYDFEPHWNAGGTLLQVKALASAHTAPVQVKALDGARTAAAIVSAIPPGAWLLVIADDSDQAGALGYHEVDTRDTPTGFVFAKTDEHYGLSWQVTASHEILEMLGDPFANICVQLGDSNTLLAYETADAVEADEDGYEVKGILLSNFVYPQWFTPGSPGPWDHRGLLKSALELRPGGYIGKWTPKTGWTQVTYRRDVDGTIRTPFGKVGASVSVPRHKQGPRFRQRAEHHAMRGAKLPAWATE